jgi:hypothetical protein
VPACTSADDEASRPAPMLELVERQGSDFENDFEPRRTALHQICVDGVTKPTQRVQVKNPGFQSVMFNVDTAEAVIVNPLAGVLDAGEQLEFSMELTPFVSVTGQRSMTVLRSDGEEMLRVDVDVVVDARLLEVTPVGWADAETFVVAIKNPTGFAATDLHFELEDTSWSDAVDVVPAGETRKVIVLDKTGKVPPLGSRVSLRSRCSEAPLPDTHFFVRATD